jgi:DNA primase
MPRIPDTEIDRLKSTLDLAALVRSRGIDLKPHGNGHLVGLCPFHDDKGTPNMVVTPGKGLFHCLACGAAGNAIQFVQKFDGISFRHAFELLDEGGQAAFSGSDEPLKRTTVPKLDNPLSSEADDAELFEQVLTYYQERLHKNPAALDYLESRGLNHPEALARFRIGFADRSLGLRMPDSARKEGKELREHLQKLGIYRKSGHEHFTGCVVVPVFDAEGGTSEIYGRRITKPNTGAPKHLYLPGPHVGIWNPEALDSPDIILCEAPLDALTFWINGIQNVTFIYGTQGFPDFLETALIEHHTKRVYLAYDADDSGDKAAERDAARLAAKGIEVFRVKFPRGMDVNEYALKVKPAAKSLAQAIKAAEWVAGSNAPSSSRAPAPSSLAADLAAKKEISNSPEPKPEPEPIRVHSSSPARSATHSVAGGFAVQKLGPSTLLRAGDYHTFELGPRAYRIGGLEKNTSLDVLRISLRIRHGEDFHTDALDLHKDADRRRFIERAAEETRLDRELIKRDLGKLLLALEQAQEERILSTSDPMTQDAKPMTGPERAEALELLRDPELIPRVQALFDDCGLVGEQTNRLAAYLACTSRKLNRPLAVIIQSTSAAGKSTLMEAVLAMFPEEERVKYSAMTGQSLYYLGETNLQHKILAIVEEEGAEKASYALKLLQSEGELTIASTGKDATTGRMETQEYHVEGPVMIFLTTTAIDIDEELLNRCLLLSVDESQAQTERIHTLQREARTLDGLRRKKRREKVLALLRNAQRLLEPVDVVNPYADQLTFTAKHTRTRRDHEKYLTLIDTIALLHQHQRERLKVSNSAVPAEESSEGEYIDVTLDDIRLANQLAPELLGRSLDELPPQTRHLLDAVKALVLERCEAEDLDIRTALFSRREIRARLGWGVTQVRAHLERLRDLEYIAARYGRPGSAFQYELLIDPETDGGTDRVGLLDPEKLTLRCEPVGENGNLSGGCRPMPRQVKNPEKPGSKNRSKRNLSACSDRTSGTESEMHRNVVIGG